MDGVAEDDVNLINTNNSGPVSESKIGADGSSQEFIKVVDSFSNSVSDVVSERLVITS